jgi:hypothetical protein
MFVGVDVNSVHSFQFLSLEVCSSLFVPLL